MVEDVGSPRAARAAHGRVASMKPDLVADIGNTRIKWGLCSAAVVEKSAALPPEDPDAWRAQLAAWKLDGPHDWTLAGVHPVRRDRFADSLKQRGHRVCIPHPVSQFPIPVKVEHP